LPNDVWPTPFHRLFPLLGFMGRSPSNLAGIQMLKQMMAYSIGCEDGGIIACSKGLHLYDHVFEQAAIRAYKTEKLVELESILGVKF